MSMLINPFNAKGGNVSLPSGLPIWARYKADAQADANGAVIVQLTDQSGNGRHATQATSTLRAVMRTGVVNGKKAFDFTPPLSEQNYYNLPNMSALTEGEVFYILKCDVNDQSDGYLSAIHQIGTATDNSHYEYGVDLIYEHFGVDVRQSFNTPVFNTAVYHCYNVKVGLTSGVNRMLAYQNNVNRADIDLTGIANISFSSAPIIGGNNAGGYLTGFAGRIAEIVLCSTRLTTAQRFDLHSYFNYEYALTMTP